MANITSTTLTNLEADPISLASAYHNAGRVHVKSESLAVAVADNNADVWRFFRVKSSDSIKSLQLINTAIVGSTDWNVGLYSINGGGDVDENLYADAITLATAAPAVAPTADGGSPIELRFGVAVTAVPGDVNNQVWQDLGLSSDPGLEYDVCMTGITVGAAVGTLALIMYYTAGD